MQFIGFTLHTIGEVLIAYTVLRVHYRVRKEHKVDSKVFKAMQKEQVLGVLGIALIVTGYLIRAPFEY